MFFPLWLFLLWFTFCGLPFVFYLLCVSFCVFPFCFSLSHYHPLILPSFSPFHLFFYPIPFSIFHLPYLLSISLFLFFFSFLLFLSSFPFSFSFLLTFPYFIFSFFNLSFNSLSLSSNLIYLCLSNLLSTYAPF